MHRFRKATGVCSLLATVSATVWFTTSASAAPIAAPATGSFWSLRPEVDAHQRSMLVDQAVGRKTGSNPYCAAKLGELVNEHHSIRFASGQHQEYFVNPEPSSMLVWATSAMGVFAAGYGYRRRSQ